MDSEAATGRIETEEYAKITGRKNELVERLVLCHYCFYVTNDVCYNNI